MSPIDSETILASVAKTGRLVIVHEAARNVGVGAEIAALVAEHGLYDLQAPMQRVTGFDTIMPLFRLEHDYIPSVQRIVDAVQLTLRTRDCDMSTFKLPDLGEGLAEAEILEWHVKPGDHVRVDQPMVSVETAKAVVEVPVPFSGMVTALHGAVGDIVATGAPLIDFDSGTVVGSMPPTSEEEFVEPRASAARARHAATPRRAVPVARALARRLGMDLAAIAGSGPGGLITLDDVLAHAQSSAAERCPRRTAGPHRVAKGSRRSRRRQRRTAARRPRRAMAHSMSLSRAQVPLQHGVRRCRHPWLDAGAATTCCGSSAR